MRNEGPEIIVEPLGLSRQKEEIIIDGLVTDSFERKIGDNAGSMFVRIPRKILGKIINILETPLDQEVSLEPIIEVLSIYDEKHGWLAVLRKPKQKKRRDKR